MKEDKRILRSKAILKENTKQLLKTKKISQISVVELVRKSGLNRSTFYANYPDIYGILEEIQDDYISDIEKIMDDDNPEYTVEQNRKNMLMSIIGYIEENKELFLRLVDESPGYTFQQKMADYFLNKFYKETTNSEKIFYWFNFRGAYSVIDRWLRGYIKISKDEICNMLILKS